MVTAWVATWAEGLRRAGIRRPNLYAVEAAAVAISTGLVATALWGLFS